MTTAFVDEAVLVHELGHLSDKLIGRATGAAPSTVRSWLAHASTPTGTRAERLAELSEVVTRLTRVMRPEYIPVWLSKPVEALEDDKPVDLIAEGEYRSVLALIRTLEHQGAV